ncbi:putative zinc-finger protein [Candida albicans P57055]|nr:putative zinc-finger protein [Candida albicans P57055]
MIPALQKLKKLQLLLWQYLRPQLLKIILLLLFILWKT